MPSRSSLRAMLSALCVSLIPSAEAFAIGMRAYAAARTTTPATPIMADLNTITLTNSAGDSSCVYTFGACVTSYIKGGTDVLMVRPDAKMDGSKPISGGIPHCFPQFGPGAMQQHGFARNLEWEVMEQADDAVVLRLCESEYTLAMWPYKFEAKYAVTLKEDRLATELTVTNTDSKPFDFTAALHSYWSISAVSNIAIKAPAFAGASFMDKTAVPPVKKKAEGSEITISGPVDSVYAGVTGDVQLVDSARARPLTISSPVGWSDTVIWNPYGDENMGYNSFVCVESAQASTPVVLGPGEYWTGAMDVIP